jgi:hypothetical protein
MPTAVSLSVIFELILDYVLSGFVEVQKLENKTTGFFLSGFPVASTVLV